MMASKLQNILSRVQKKTTPSIKEKKRILMLAEKLRKRVEKAANRAGLNVNVRVEGSIAKDTWLREAPDIDIFMQVPPNTPREALGTTYLTIAKKATRGAEQTERFAEHPYLEAFLDGTRVNIVPCYRAREGEWKSATDRTPFHTDYVKPLLNEKLCGWSRDKGMRLQRISLRTSRPLLRVLLESVEGCGQLEARNLHRP